MKKYIPLLIVTALVFIAGGCAPSRQVSEERVISSDRLIKKLEANRRKVKTFRGTGALNIFSPDLTAGSSFEVIVKKPDSLKVSFYGPFGIDLAHALITPQDFQFYDVINNSLYRGKMRDGIMKQILKVDFSFDELIDALAGSVNLTDKLRIEPDRFEVDGDLYRLTYLDSLKKIEKVYSVRADDLAISENILKQFNGNILVEGKYSRFKSYEDVPIPQEIILNDIVNKQRLKVEYRKIEINRNDVDLLIDIPTDVKIREW